MPKPQMRCPNCRMWQNAESWEDKIPEHKDRATGDWCKGGGKRPAQKRGKFDK